MMGAKERRKGWHRRERRRRLLLHERETVPNPMMSARALDVFRRFV